MKYSKLIGVGGYLPKNIITNDSISKHVDTSDEWIVERTGIKSRHVIEKGQTTSDLASKALDNALKQYNIDKQTIDGIIVATVTPDKIFPSTAALTQKKSGIALSGFAMDINASCAGFVYALNLADSLIKSGSYNRIAVIGADIMSGIIDWKDRKTCVLFGDGAGAFVFEAVNEKTGILSCDMGCDGSLSDILKVEGGISLGAADSAKIEMDGRDVFKNAIVKMSQSSVKAMEKAGLSKDDIDWFVPHQANQRIIDAIGKNMDIQGKMVSSLAHHANTSAASIPLAFKKYVDEGLINKGDKIVFTAAGGGFAWGSVVMEY